MNWSVLEIVRKAPDADRSFQPRRKPDQLDYRAHSRSASLKGLLGDGRRQRQRGLAVRGGAPLLRTRERVVQRAICATPSSFSSHRPLCQPLPSTKPCCLGFGRHARIRPGERPTRFAAGRACGSRRRYSLYSCPCMRPAGSERLAARGVSNSCVVWASPLLGNSGMSPLPAG